MCSYLREPPREALKLDGGPVGRSPKLEGWPTPWELEGSSAGGKTTLAPDRLSPQQGDPGAGSNPWGADPGAQTRGSDASSRRLLWPCCQKDEWVLSMLMDMSYLVAMTALRWRGFFGALKLIIFRKMEPRGVGAIVWLFQSLYDYQIWPPEEWGFWSALVISKQSNILDGNY